MDEFVRHCLLDGLDDICLTLQHESEITTYEAAHPLPHALMAVSAVNATSIGVKNCKTFAAGLDPLHAAIDPEEGRLEYLRFGSYLNLSNGSLVFDVGSLSEWSCR